MELEHLSYSSIKAYLDCARNWRFKYVQKLPTYSTPALIFGSAIHGAVEAYLSQPKRDKTPADCWAEAWQQAITGKGEIAWGADRPEAHYNEGLRILSDKTIHEEIAAIRPAWDDKGPKIERKVELHIPGVPLPVIGYIDIQTEDGVPSDFKTSSRSWSDEQASSETQSLFYLAALNQAGCSVQDWKFRHFVIVKTKTPQFQTYTHCHSPREIFWLFSMIRNVWRGIENEVFPESPGSWKCNPRFCDFWAKCRGR